MQQPVESLSPTTGGACTTRIFYGWYIAVAATVIYYMNIGATYSLPPLFYPNFIAEFKATEAAVSLCTAIQYLLGGLAAPFAGALIDRFGARRLMRFGILLLAASVTLYPFVGALWHLYVLHSLFALVQPLCGLLATVVLLSNWFVVRRGAVVGMLVAGASLAGATLPNMVAPIIANPAYGWRWGYGLVAGLVWLVAVPLTFFVVKTHPREVGEYADGRAPAKNAVNPAREPIVLPGVTFEQALRTGVLWFLALGSAFILFAIGAVQTQLVIYLKQDLGFSHQLAAFFLSLTWMFSIAGKFGFGYLSDRLTKRRVMILTTSLLFSGTLFLLTFDPGSGRFPLSLVTNRLQITVFAVLFGLGFGGCFSMIQLMTAECFGPRSLGRILGVVYLLDNLGGFAGISLVGFLRTATGSYLVPFMTIVLVSFLGVINVWFVRPVPYEGRVS